MWPGVARQVCTAGADARGLPRPGAGPATCSHGGGGDQVASPGASRKWRRRPAGADAVLPGARADLMAAPRAGPGDAAAAALDELSRNLSYWAPGAGNGSLSGEWYRRNQVRPPPGRGPWLHPAPPCAAQRSPELGAARVGGAGGRCRRAPVTAGTPACSQPRLRGEDAPLRRQGPCRSMAGPMRVSLSRPSQPASPRRIPGR